MSRIDSESENIKEVRAARKALWAEHGNDIHEICSSMREREAELKKQGAKFVSASSKLPPDFYERIESLNASRDHLSAA